MLFNSTQFAIFFPIVAALYFATPQRFRWCLLLAAGYYFYACWKPGYTVLIIISTLVDYTAGLLMGAAASRARKRAWLVLSLCTNLGLLFFFKYFNFFNEALAGVLDLVGVQSPLPASRFLLPVGLSFYTFQSLTYTIGVYRGTVKPERHLGIFACYVCFFPQLVAGPIERAQNLLPQFFERHPFDYERVTHGLKLMAWGLFQKMVIADRLAVLVDQVYGDLPRYQGVGLAIATVLFAFQIYCDFSGYTDIAIGAAEVLGFRLMANFQRPYFASSIPEFWHRWHISLSTWFRDYVYIPLGGNRVGRLRWDFNIMVVFLLSGLWHGANWTFLIWGALHGLYMLCSRRLEPLRARLAAATRLDCAPRLRHALQVAFTFTLVCFAWIFFRARSLQEAVYVVRNLFQGWSILFDLPRLYDTVFSLGLSQTEFFFAVAMIGVMLAGHGIAAHGGVDAFLARKPIWVRWTLYSLLVWCIFLFGIYRHKEFIYFTF
jgi:D-alanyl-lipoteichoic acid acyltransferase DltB (MBOAT superfamily)